MRVHTKWIVALMVGTLALAGVACGGGDETTTSATETEPAGTTTADAGTTTTAAAEDLSGVRLVWTDYGGETHDAIQAQALSPFSEQTGAEVVSDIYDGAKLATQVESGNVTWDVDSGADPSFVEANCGTLYEQLDASVFEGIDEKYVTSDCYQPQGLYVWMLVYDESKFGDDPPTSWADFFDLEKYPGKRGMWSYLFPGAQYEAALLGDGVAADALYPLDVDRAAAKIGSIKDDILFYDSLGQAQEQMQAGSVAMQLAINTRANFAANQGAQIAPVWQDALVTWGVLAVPKGSQNKAGAESLFRFIAQPSIQTGIMDATAQGTTTVGAVPTEGAVNATFFPSEANLGTSVLYSPAWWAENTDAAYAAWAAAVVQ